MKQGYCPQCAKLRWLGGKGGLCKPCAYPTGICAQCSKTAKLYVDSLCYLCYQHRQVRCKLLEIELYLTPIEEYPSHLFALYLIYIRRYWLKYYHIRQIEKLSQILIQNPPPVILSWMQIYEFSSRDKFVHQPSLQNGCAWIKIGCMLQELGVLPPRSDETEGRLEKILLEFDPLSLRLVRLFLGDLKRAQRSPATLVNQAHSLRKLSHWIKRNSPEASLLSMNGPLMQNYLDHLHDLDFDSKFLRDHFSYANRFYRWCVQHKVILSNPCQGIQVNREAAGLPICSLEQTQKLFNFIKNQTSPPEYAMMIALVLFFGFTNQDLAYAQLDSSVDVPLSIILRRKARTYGRHFYNRAQVFPLPRQPAWFLALQKRFLNQWQEDHACIKKTYPRQSLFLPYNKLSNRPLNTDTILDRFRLATQLATGTAIPVRIVRQTCGHLHSQKSDASVLTCLGWSPRFAFHYTWLPRSYFHRKNTASSSSPT